MIATYGDQGNRWWAGLNVGSDQSSLAGTGTFLSPNGYESLPSGNAADDKQFAAAAGKNKGAANPVTISVENVSWYNINGPFTSQVAANAALPAIAKAHPAPGEIQQLTAGGQGSASNGGGVNLGTNSITGFLGALGSSHTWVRVAKVAIGGTMLIVGVAKLTGLEQQAPVLAKAVKAAPLL